MSRARDKIGYGPIFRISDSQTSRFFICKHHLFPLVQRRNIQTFKNQITLLNYGNIFALLWDKSWQLFHVFSSFFYSVASSFMLWTMLLLLEWLIHWVVIVQFDNKILWLCRQTNGGFESYCKTTILRAQRLVEEFILLVLSSRMDRRSKRHMEGKQNDTNVCLWHQCLPPSLMSLSIIIKLSSLLYRQTLGC